jgi:hypothetical protein
MDFLHRSISNCAYLCIVISILFLFVKLSL